MEEITKIIAENFRTCNTENNSDIFKDLQLGRVETYNSSYGNLTGYDCKECLNKGFIAVIDDSGYEIMKQCKCAVIRHSIRNIEKSGLKNIIEDCTFEKFTEKESWQVNAKNIALDFLERNDGGWFFAGGQIGAGKTHLCTAIVGEFLRKGKTARYMLWRDEATRLKAIINDGIEYRDAINELKNVDVLYIDDFFKTERGKSPTTGDINLAFELINYRYNNKKYITIISSEKTVEEILEIDEAVGSRIYQRTKTHCLIIGKDINKNYRLK